jgi:hypothetical protein
MEIFIRKPWDKLEAKLKTPQVLHFTSTLRGALPYARSVVGMEVVDGFCRRGSAARIQPQAREIDDGTTLAPALASATTTGRRDQPPTIDDFPTRGCRRCSFSPAVADAPPLPRAAAAVSSRLLRRRLVPSRPWPSSPMSPWTVV